MAKKLTAWKTKGMNQDLSVSAFNPEFAFENMNLRLSTNEGNTLMSWVNEKGTEKLSIVDKEDNTFIIQGTPIGTAILNHKLVIFTTGGTIENETEDCIYVLEYNADKTKLVGELLYHGNLSFDTEHPIETLVSYESEYIQKVYWTDNKNQPRMINIVSDTIKESVDTQFDFISELQLNETIKVQKMLGATGMFAPGVIQYAFTYYTKYGQESNIFYTTPLYYISHKDRGASPEDKVENAFKITVENVDTNFDYLRIYSIQRTSLNGTPLVKRIQDIEIEGLTNNTASYLDTGFSGNTVDPMELLYKGGDTIIVKTLEQKDGTLFLGNIQSTKDIKEEWLRKFITSDKFVFIEDTRSIYFDYDEGAFYPYANQLTSFADSNKTISIPCAGFKCGDYYRLGVQFQYKTGKWSDPIYIKNKRITKRPTLNTTNLNTTNPHVDLPIITGILSISQADADTLIKEGFRKVRAVVVYPDMKDRYVICQGVVNPTLYTDNQRGIALNDTQASGAEIQENTSNRMLRREEDDSVEQPDTNEQEEGDLEGGGNEGGGSSSSSDDTIQGDLYAQSSWFFRPKMNSDKYINKVDGVTVSPKASSVDTLEYIDNSTPECPNTGAIPEFREVEIEGAYANRNKFRIDTKMVSLHSPDIEFDDQLSVINFEGLEGRIVADVRFEKTASDIDIQTESPTIAQIGTGFVHKAFKKDGSYGIVSGLFYDDAIVDDSSNDMDAEFTKHPEQLASCKWLIYPWQSSGSLNNDINRPTDKGTPTAILKKKIISNLRYAGAPAWRNGEAYGEAYIDFIDSPQLFNSDEVTIVKLGDKFYKGNIDTLLYSSDSDGKYFAYDGLTFDMPPTIVAELNTGNEVHTEKETPFNSSAWCKLWSKSSLEQSAQGIRKWDSNLKCWIHSTSGVGHWVGDGFLDLVRKKASVRLKYKSSAHLVINSNDSFISDRTDGTLPVVEIVRDLGNIEEERKFIANLFGGESQDALRENTWIPCGEPVDLSDWETRHDPDGDYEGIFFDYSYGDTYFQRWDCLKTYAFTPEDINQVVEIGSFMLETHTNIDGRYDRNRAQSSNLYMSPQNFNLLNPVYSQLNNFFSYKIKDEDSYKDTFYPNQITWTKTKNSGEDVDPWTNITMASVLELDGDKGQVNKLVRFNNYLFAFQDSGIAQILYNDNVQISATDGVPIEIANSGKVSGKDYKSNTIGCSNKWSMVQTPNGIYFMDSNDKSIYLFNGQLQNMSSALGFNSWAKNEIPAMDVKWNPVNFGAETADDKSTFMACFDKKNQDVLFINNDKALAYSEKLNRFTSFYDYGRTPFFCNLDDVGIWIRTDGTLWKHQEGDYCRFFGHNKPYWMTLVGNPEPQLDKIFTNIEFRASVEGDGEYDGSTDKFTPALPFDSLEVWNEYQHGYTALNNKSGHSLFKHGGNDSALIRKFRMWRCDIPRDNVDAPEEDTERGIYRKAKHSNDRMRNSWLYLKLMKNAVDDTPSVVNQNLRRGGEIEGPDVNDDPVAPSQTLNKVEVHDLIMTYYG